MLEPFGIKENRTETIRHHTICSWKNDCKLAKRLRQEFSFYMVQIAPYNYHSTNNGPALIREAQEQVAHRVDNVGLITTTDIGDPDNIHPAQKAEAGFRLANLVLGRTYKALKKVMKHLSSHK